MTADPNMPVLVFPSPEEDQWWRALTSGMADAPRDPLEELIATATGESFSVWKPQPALDASALEMDMMQLALIGQPEPGDGGWAAPF